MNQSNESKLAYEIANKLDDMKSIDLHLSFAKKYSESYLRDTLRQVMATPQESIRRTRAAYYTYLVLKHGQHSRN
jgi:hypothetical protein